MRPRAGRAGGPLTWVRRLVGLLALLTLPWAAGLLWFVGNLPGTVDDPARHTDAIVVLTGGSERLTTGIELLAEGMAGKLFVSGVYRGVEVEQLIRLAQRDPKALECCVEPGHGARNTMGNARETAEWVRRNKVASIRLVTANYHMPRALLEFRHALDGVETLSHPVFPPNVKVDQWWIWPGTAELVISEYNKFLLAWLRLRLEDLLLTDS